MLLEYNNIATFANFLLNKKLFIIERTDWTKYYKRKKSWIFPNIILQNQKPARLKFVKSFLTSLVFLLFPGKNR